MVRGTIGAERPRRPGSPGGTSVAGAVATGPRSYGPGLDRDAMLAAFRARLSAAPKTGLSRKDVGAAVATWVADAAAVRDAILSLRPAAAGPRWIEWSTLEASEAAAWIGSPRVKVGGASTSAVGFLLSEGPSPDVLRLEMAVTNLVELPGAGAPLSLTDISPTRGSFDAGPGVPLPPRQLAAIPAGVTGALRAHWEGLARDPGLAAASVDIPWRVSWERHPDMAALWAAHRGGPDAAEAYERGTGRDLVMHAVTVLLPFLAVEAGFPSGGGAAGP